MRMKAGSRGYSLIELMVAMVIALILMAGVTRVFIASGDTYQRMEGLATLQDNGRFAMSFLQTTMQGTGYIGCRAANVNITNNLQTPTNYAWNYAQPIIGYDDVGAGVWAPVPDPSITAPLPGSDIITVRGANGPAVSVTANMPTPTSAVSINPNNTFGQGAILLVSDCNGNADVFQKTDVATVTAAHGVMGGFTPGNATAALSTTYSTTGVVVSLGTSTFYLRAGAAAPSSLYVIQDNNAPLELVEGVDGMQILYGVTNNTDTSANQYMTAAAVDAGGLWGQVVSVRIALLMSTPFTVPRYQDTRVYNLLGVNYGPFNDARMRRVFTTTISLRNRSF